MHIRAAPIVKLVVAFIRVINEGPYFNSYVEVVGDRLHLIGLKPHFVLTAAVIVCSRVVVHPVWVTIHGNLLIKFVPVVNYALHNHTPNCHIFILCTKQGEGKCSYRAITVPLYGIYLMGSTFEHYCFVWYTDTAIFGIYQGA